MTSFASISRYVVVGGGSLDFLIGESGGVGHNNSNDDAVEAKSTSKNLDDQHGDESRGSLGVCAGSHRADNTDRESTGHVAHTDDEASEEVAVAGILGNLIGDQVDPWVSHAFLGSSLQNDCHDKAVDSDSLAENDRHQVLGDDARHLDCGSDDGRSRQEDSPTNAPLDI